MRVWMFHVEHLHVNPLENEWAVWEVVDKLPSSTARELASDSAGL